MTTTISHLSTQYVNVPITAPLNPTGDTVQMAFKAPGNSPGAGDWINAAWATTTSPYSCQVLAGPDNGVISLAPMTYSVWVKITDNPEVPVLLAGQVQVF